MKLSPLLRSSIYWPVFVLFVLSLVGSERALGQVVINEILVDNDSIAPLEDHPDYFPDYVELRNASPTNINLGTGQWSLTASGQPTNATRFLFPNTAIIPANGYLLVFLDDETSMPGIHFDFSLEREQGDDLYLYSGNGTALVDSIVFGIQMSDYAIGRIPDGTGAFSANIPTPGSNNLAAVLGDPGALRINEWSALTTEGSGRETNDWFEIYNSSSNVVALTGLVFTDRDSNEVAEADSVVNLSFIRPFGFQIILIFDDANDADEFSHFSLSSNGDEIWIFGTTNLNSAIDHVEFGPQQANVSRGRLPDGGPVADDPFPTNRRSPGASNLGSIINIVINEVLAHTDPPLEDAIELYNPTEAPVDISNWWLSNAEDVPKKFRVPDGTVIPAGGYKVFYEGDFNPDGSFELSSDHGDEVFLFTGDSDGNLTGLRRSIDFGPSENGVSFGRFITSRTNEDNVDIVAMSSRSFGMDNPATVQQFRMGGGATNPYPRVGPIIINEIHYHPPDDGTNDNVLHEFVELYNPSAEAVTLHQSGTPWSLDGDVRLEFPPSLTMASGEYLLVVNFDPEADTNQLASFRAEFDVPDGTQIYGPYQGKLNNRGGPVELRKPDPPEPGFVPMVLVERIRYEDRDGWPTNADGGGASLQRRTSENYGNEPLNWRAETPTPGGPNIGSCILTLSHSNAAFSGIGGSSNVSFTTGMDCDWTVVNTNTWITITSATSGTGDATATYSVDTNRTSTTRTGRFRIGNVNFTVTQTRGDSSKPSVTIAAPGSNARLFTASTNLQGTARDDMTLGSVQLSVNSNAFQTASGTTAWMIPIELAPGANNIQVKSVDLFGNESTVVSRTIFYVVTSTITVRTNGSGSIKPVLDGQNLEVGKSYTLTATPASGFVLSNWSKGDGVAGTASRLTFPMESNLTLTANFVPNPFIGAKGAYNGLFQEADDVRLHSSGFLNVVVTDKGSFSGKLQMGKQTFRVAGQFDLDGHAAIDVVRRGTNALRLELDLDLSGASKQITGSVSEPNLWEAEELTLDRAVFHKTTNAAPWAGNYTIVIPGDPGDVAKPGGDGFGTVIVDAGGNARLAGTLGDGTKITQKVPISENGQWPLYVPLYRGLGALLSWINLDTNALSSDAASWIKLPHATKLYSGGFTNDPMALVSPYVAPVGPTNRAINITNGIVAFVGGDLSAPLTNTISIGPSSKVTNGGPATLTLTLTPKSGLYKGAVTDPSSNRKIPFQGVILQKSDTGHGFFTGTNQTGQVRIEGAP